MSDHQHSISYPATSHIHTFTPTNFNQLVETTRGYYVHPEQEEKPMTTLEKMRQERIEARERARIATMYEGYDEHLVEIERSIYTFNTQPGSDDERTYAALFVGGAWYVTGRESPNGLNSEDFVAWLIGKDVEVGDLVLVT
jgi:hypothetical protein